MDLDLNQYIDVFVEEAKEHLQNMNEALLELEKDTSNISLINEIFRVAHTLKGMSGTMGFINMSNLTHEMENVLHGVRSNVVTLNEDIIDIIFECFDMLDYSINLIATNGQEKDDDYKDLIHKLRSISDDSQMQENRDESSHKKLEDINEYVLNILEEAKNKGLISYKIDIILSTSCMLKAARAFIIFNNLESIGEIVYSNPSVEDIEDEKFDSKFSVVFISEFNSEKIKEELSSISEIDDFSINRLDVDSLMTNLQTIEENTEKSNKFKKELLKRNEKDETTNRTNMIGKTVRVDIDRLDNLMNLVSELIIIKTRMDELSQSSNKENMAEAIEYLERITTSIHDAVMKVRMVPIERVFNRFPRMVRDLSKELEKEINLQMSGKDTEVDRTVIDEIGEPLIHIIRNSIDHGIETPEERIKRGKKKEGTIILKAYANGNSVIIEAEDDGKGLDGNEIKEKAIQKGVISKQEGELLSEEEAIALLFTPGFSTTEEVSDISGRGVGLDVVKSKIESISGSIEVDTQLYKGTKFTIRLPLTLAIIQALLIRLSNEIYAIPLSSITEIIKISKEEIKSIHDQEVILYRGKTIPIIELNRIVGVNDIEKSDEYIAIIARKGEKQAALLVDGLIGQQEIVIKPLGKYLSNIKYLSGATILGDGNISLILDVNSLM